MSRLDRFRTSLLNAVQCPWGAGGVLSRRSVDEDAKQSVIDTEHLKLLRWGYFLSGAMTVLMWVLAAARFRVAKGAP